MQAMDWLRTHKAEWKRRQPRIETNVAPKTFFGEENASDEWTPDNRPERVFAHIASYDDFRADSSLFLFGRRGTGKSTILHMFKHDIDQKNPHNRGHLCCALVNPHSFIELVLKPNLGHGSLSQLASTELQALIRNAWQWYLVVCCYCELAFRQQKYRTSKSPLAAAAHDEIARGRTTSLHFSEFAKGKVSLLFSTILEEVPDGPNQLPLIVAKLTEKFTEQSVQSLQDAISSAYKVTKKLVVGLVETQEVYHIYDDLSSAVRTALIDAALDFYNQHWASGLLIKAAFPSEIVPHLEVANREKVEGKSVVILWRYRDLVSLIAKRYRRVVEPRASAFSQFDDYKTAKQYLYTVLPPSIPTRNHVELDTLGYIIRHTQKKPRQIIIIFNCLLTMALDRNKVISQLGGEIRLIQEAVHERLDFLALGALHIYNNIYKNADEIVRRTLTRMRCYFLARELDSRIAQTNEIRDPLIERHDVRQLLLNAGVLGIATDAPSSVKIANGNSFLMLEANFEYQIKGGLTLTNDSLCVIHPMFYEVLHIEIDTRIVAHPRPTDEEEELLIRQ